MASSSGRGLASQESREPRAYSVKLQRCNLTALSWATVSAGLQNDEQESRPLTPEDVICINAPHNRIDSASLSDGLHQFGHLCMLGLQNNALSSIDPQVLPKSLLYLNLASNDLTSLGNLKLPKLVSLDASNNSLQELPTMSGMPSLVEVRLNGNKLTALEGVEDAQRLHTLHVANNCITSIMQLRPLSMCKSLCNLAITGNPLPKKLLSNHGHVALRNLLPGLTTLDGRHLPGRAPYRAARQLSLKGTVLGAASLHHVLPTSGPCEDPAAVQPCAAATPVPQALIENMLAALDEHQEAPGQLLLPEGWQAPAALAAPLGAARLTAAQPLSASGQLLSDPQRQACLRGSQQPPHTTTLHQAQFCGIIPKDSHRAHSRKLTVRPNKAHVLRTRINTTFWTPDAVVQLVPQGPATFRKTATSRPSGLRQPASLAFGTSAKPAGAVPVPARSSELWDLLRSPRGSTQGPDREQALLPSVHAVDGNGGHAVFPAPQQPDSPQELPPQGPGARLQGTHTQLELLAAHQEELEDLYCPAPPSLSVIAEGTEPSRLSDASTDAQSEPSLWAPAADLSQRSDGTGGQHTGEDVSGRSVSDEASLQAIAPEAEALQVPGLALPLAQSTSDAALADSHAQPLSDASDAAESTVASFSTSEPAGAEAVSAIGATAATQSDADPLLTAADGEDGAELASIHHDNAGPVIQSTEDLQRPQPSKLAASTSDAAVRVMLRPASQKLSGRQSHPGSPVHVRVSLWPAAQPSGA